MNFTGKRIKRGFFAVFAAAIVFGAGTLRAALEIRESSNLVDGVHNNPLTIVRTPSGARAPVFSWEIAGGEVVTSFIIAVATNSLESDMGSVIWMVTGSTTSSNMTRMENYDIVAVPYEGGALTPSASYYWGVQAYGSGGSTTTALGRFTTISAAYTPVSPTIDLKIDRNNPLKPGREAHLVAAAFDRDRNLKMRVFSLAGELVMDWPSFIVPKNTLRATRWDGTDINGRRLRRGIYIVNLYDESDKVRVNGRIAILDR